MAKFFLKFLLLVSVLLIDGLDQLQGSSNDNRTADITSAQLLKNALCHNDEGPRYVDTLLDLDGDGYFHIIGLSEAYEEEAENGLPVLRKKFPFSNYADSIHCLRVSSYLASYRKHVLRRSKDFCHIASRRHLFLAVLRN